MKTFTIKTETYKNISKEVRLAERIDDMLSSERIILEDPATTLMDSHCRILNAVALKMRRDIFTIN
jgi:hypothetical protein